MSDSVIVALTAVAVSFINMIGSVLILWIRARYRWTNGQGKDRPDQGPPPS